MTDEQFAVLAVEVVACSGAIAILIGLVTDDIIKEIRKAIDRLAAAIRERK